MSETLVYSKDATKEILYAELLPQLRSLIQGEPDLIANLANVAAALKEVFGFFWVGFYLVKDDELVLGRSRVRSPVLVSLPEEGCAARLGKKEKH